MTKTIIIGQPEESKKELNKIEFIAVLNKLCGDAPFLRATCKPNEYEFIELICLNYRDDGTSLMFAYDQDQRNLGHLYIGHWNDGVV